MGQRNGAGKTTSAANLGCMLALSGARVLLVDFDPQASLTNALGVARPDADAIKTLYISEGLLAGGVSATYEENLFILPSCGSLGSLEIEHQSSHEKTLLLKTALESISAGYDYILIDTPSLLEFFIANAARASDAILMPVPCFPGAVRSFVEFRQYLDNAIFTKDKIYRFIGVFINYFSPASRLCVKTLEDIRKQHSGLIFETRIPRCRTLAESAHAGMAAAGYDVTALGSISYAKLAREVLYHVGAKVV
jgi:chromosome partitioning protein